MKNWTADQLKAIESRDQNLLVSAAAGSGKTALLIERIFRIVAEGTPVDQLLVLTFTKGAAGEMKNRLNQAFSKALELAEGEVRKQLLTQMNLLGNAAISTFHSFCLNLLRIYFHKASIDPGFAIGNDIEMTLMRKEALEEVFEDFYQKEDPAFLKLVDQYAGNRSDQALKDLVEDFYFFLSAQPYSQDYCQKALENFDFEDFEDFEKGLWGQKLKATIIFQLTAARDYAEKAKNASAVPGFEKAYGLIEKEAEAIGAILSDLKNNSDDLSGAIERINAIEFKRFTGNKKADEERNESIKAYRNQAKKRLLEIGERYGKHFSLRLSQLKSTKAIMETLIQVTIRLGQVFKEKKRKKNSLDYNDLEQLSLKLLADPAVQKEIQSRYAAVFIDEYQDTNEMQETILQKIVRPQNFFMVGDVKQSIYRFRLADPGIFMEKYQKFGKNEKNGIRIDLNKNFRSSQAVINSVNALFSKIMSVELGEIQYDQRVQLNLGLASEKRAENQKNEKTEIHLLYQKNQAEEFSRAELEAAFIAKKIQSLIGTPLYRSRSGQEELIQYQDFGVLLRSVARNGEIYLKVFREYGIPTHFEGESRYYESLEITTMINLLNLLDNDHQDIPLLSLMVSPIGHFEAEECTKIRINHPEGYFYEAVAAYRDQMTDPLSDKLRDFYQKLSRWQKLSKRLAVDTFLWTIYMESDYYQFVGVLPGGQQRQNNLKILLKRAADYKKSSLKGLYQFIRFIENMKKYQQDVSPSQSISHQDNVVRLMTIHKSKGLEFPIVFIGGLSGRFNKRDNAKPVLFHKQLGICPDYVDEEKRFRQSTLAKEICKDQNNLELLSEEMRLLYVAMTRAEEKLHLVAGLKEADKASWREEPHPHQLITSLSFLDWIMTAILKDQHLDEKSIELGHFQLYQHFEEELKAVKSSEGIIPPIKVEPEIQKRVDSYLNFDYNRQSKQVLPGKMSVTEIAQIRKDKDFLAAGAKADGSTRQEKPLFLKNVVDTFSPAEKGTALHLLLEVLNLKALKEAYGEKSERAFGAYLKSFLKAEKQRLIVDDYLPEALGESIDLKKIEAFYLSALGKRILKSPLVKREWAFTYQLEPGEIRPEWQAIKEPILIQGIIDCVFKEAGQWVIVDYKTDFFKDEAERRDRISRYQPQIELYGEALNQLSDYPVKEKIISFIGMGQNVTLS